MLPSSGRITKIEVNGQAKGNRGKPMLIIQKVGANLGSSFNPDETSSDVQHVRMVYEFANFPTEYDFYEAENNSTSSIILEKDDILILGIYAQDGEEVEVHKDFTISVSFVPSSREGFPKNQRQYEATNNQAHQRNIKFFHVQPLGINSKRMEREYYRF
jgi:hypothetical protein